MPAFKSKDTAAERFRETYKARLAGGGRAGSLAKHVVDETRAMLDRLAKREENLTPVARLLRKCSVHVSAERNPQRALDALSVFDLRRNMECKNYEGCLSHAAKMDWRGFHCEACPLNTSER